MLPEPPENVTPPVASPVTVSPKPSPPSLMAPEKSTADAPSAFTVESAVSNTDPESVTRPSPESAETVPPERTRSLDIVPVLTRDRVAPPSTVAVPLPSASGLSVDRVPPLTVVPPW